MREYPDLSANQARAIAALLVKRTIREAAADAKCDESTVRRWLRHDPAFQQAWRQARTMLMDEAIGLAQKAASEAIVVLRDCMLNSDLDTARIAAARVVLEVGLKALERDELRGQIAHIVRELNELRRQQPQFAATTNGHA